MGKALKIIKKHIIKIGFYFFIVIIPLVVYSIIFCDRSLWEFIFSNYIFYLTAIIIFYYTFETHKIRKIEQTEAEALRSNTDIVKDRYFRPVIAYQITTSKNFKEIVFIIENLSDHPVSLFLKCNLKIDNNIVDVPYAYNGKEYWNIYYKNNTMGYINWLNLFLSNGVIELDSFNDINASHHESPVSSKLKTALKNNYPNFTMDVELFSINEFKQYTYYPPVHYDFNFEKLIWIPVVTSKNPYWVYDKKPDWVNHNFTINPKN